MPVFVFSCVILLVLHQINEEKSPQELSLLLWRWLFTGGEGRRGWLGGKKVGSMSRCLDLIRANTQSFIDAVIHSLT